MQDVNDYMVVPSVRLILEDPTLFNRWMIKNDGLDLLNEQSRAFAPAKGQYYLCDYFAGELWLCLSDDKTHTTRGVEKRNLPVCQITNDMRRDYGNVFNGCYYLETQ